MTQENKDIQPQAEPYIVKSHDIHVDADYANRTNRMMGKVNHIENKESGGIYSNY
jgi:hypothetical protein